MKNWPRMKLNDLLEAQNGYAFSSKDYVEAGHFVMRIGNVQNGFIVRTDPTFVQLPRNGQLSRFELAEGDILVSLTGNIGRVGVVAKEHLPAVLNQRVARLSMRDHSPMSKSLLFYFLSSGYFRDELTGTGHGAAQQNVSTKDLLAIEIAIPSKQDQTRIVDILDEAFDGVATARANAEKNLQNARELFESHLQSVFTIADEKWMMTSLGAEVDLLLGFAFKSTGYTDRDDGVRLLRGDNIVQGVLRWDDVKRWPVADTDDYQKYQLQNDDVVLAMDRPWVKAGLKRARISEVDIPCLLVQRTACLRGGAKLESSFLMYLIGSIGFTQHILGVQTGSGVPHISGQQIKDFSFLKPPLKQQRLIAAQLDELRENVQRLESLYQQKLSALAELKKSLLHEAFSGRL